MKSSKNTLNLSYGFNPQNPEGCQPAGPVSRPPAFFGLKPDPNLTLVKLLRPNNLELPEPMPCLQKDPVIPANEIAGLASKPKITGAATAGESKKLSVECRPPRDDKSCNSKKEFKFFIPTQPVIDLPVWDATKGFQTLVDGTTWPEGDYKSFPMADGHTYTLGHQKVTH
ncbi:hypothetical protein DSO57_1004961 [Entomophthora muscae]|uniref:Uncharacterized protein n=1 Tax=Entomophthora muscae TaxID=34485 RepID=A0ACC2U6J1_9FUNG|nr:hypothetical protein DSO57_1004961 [Entomophthora muscae]